MSSLILNLAKRRAECRRLDQIRWFALGVYFETRPAIFTGVLDFSGTDRIHFNISLTDKKIGFLLDDAGI
ncbi:MAG: hypothetical protein D3923_19100 [Candidatus Electrothrix sp. AR3]|nr:hypothetical protein [Candidatus Electrothrix sp. AR3]